ncbi:hypothetical protein S820908_198 [Synechococcus phage S-CAM9]|uniref:Uncharacterized protein n=1 Tax=Synechococcus phage S-CAM9 TaxID=1883369 RepID=A0A1D8KQC0_9CAUD|nr:hypothetical protein BOW85_gp050 [Synechococcus phage S-CAM9]AOV60345.1 hypothetical protein S050808_198 [Synechococcus phage S-CAM9]AOV60573.1 hypothetical protein S820908_198 [Synechococcus phage S-CAM9]AOV60802.1 hypothetical protein N161109_199 [Synechococcus phage S-CAM9]
MPLRKKLNLEKARDIHRDEIRASRKKAFADADGEFVRALETDDSDAIEAVKAKKQTLRDLPNRSEIDNLNTINELKADWPTDLLGYSPYNHDATGD